METWCKWQSAFLPMFLQTQCNLHQFTAFWFMTGVCMLSMPPGQVEKWCVTAVAIGRLPGWFNFAITTVTIWDSRWCLLIFVGCVEWSTFDIFWLGLIGCPLQISRIRILKQLFVYAQISCVFLDHVTVWILRYTISKSISIGPDCPSGALWKAQLNIAITRSIKIGKRHKAIAGTSLLLSKEVWWFYFAAPLLLWYKQVEMNN